MPEKVNAVSINVSPFTTLLVVVETLKTSALKRFAANSNEALVLALVQKKGLVLFLPRKLGTFLIGRLNNVLKEAAVFKIKFISSIVRSSIPNKSFLQTLFIHLLLV